MASLPADEAAGSGTVVVRILLGGWVLGSRVTERKKLDLPLWRAAT